MSKKRNWESTDENLEPQTDPTSLTEETTPTVPGKTETTPQPIARIEPVTKEADPSSLMTLRVFATLAGPKWDQMAGFVAWAQLKKLQPMTMEQWRVEFRSFKNRPVG